MQAWLQILIGKIAETLVKAFFKWLKEESEKDAIEQGKKAGKVAKAFMDEYNTA